MKKQFLKWSAPFLVLITGAGIMVILIATRSVPKKEERTFTGVPVHVIQVKKKDYKANITGTGTVQAAQEIIIIPQVSGIVKSVSPSFAAGGFFSKGSLLFEVDDSDYMIAVEQAKAKVANAEYEISVVESRARIARQEWERIRTEKEESPNPLVLYEPQLKNAKAALASAAAALKQAELDLERTKVIAPFNCLVRSESVEPGQYVRSGSGVGVLIGTDAAEIIVPLPIDELPWLRIPKQAYEGIGSESVIRLNLAGKILEWHGNISRSLREVDSKSRMVSVVVTVKDPYRLGSARPIQALPVGAFVEVEFKGKAILKVVSIPIKALRENSTVWIMDNENMLRIKKIKAIRTERERVFVSEGLKDGDFLVTTALTGAADGMKLRPLKEEEEKEK